jgi:hypothetical protein
MILEYYIILLCKYMFKESLFKYVKFKQSPLKNVLKCLTNDFEYFIFITFI